ncbi:MAG: DNA polymerase Y family protein [Deltaproteobacteria bacterium]|nr:DNA polymerase Y family protein [Deltaproteobacteria bacterium]
MTRVAALRAPTFSLQALWRTAPTRRDEVLAIVGAVLTGGGDRIWAASPAAARLGIRPPITVAQARAVVPALTVIPRDPVLEAAAAEVLLTLMQHYSSRIERETAGDEHWLFADVAGLDRLVGPPAEVARLLLCEARHAGLVVTVGVARTKTLARLAADVAADTCIVAETTAAEQAFVAGLPLAALRPEPALALRLRRFGLTTVADLLALPAARVGDKLGPSGLSLLRRARGEEEGGGLQPAATPVVIGADLSLDYALDNLEPLLAVLDELLGRLLVQLAARGYLCGDLRLSFVADGGERFERLVRVSAPSRERPALLALCRLHLSEAPLPAPVIQVAVVATPASLQPVQLALFSAPRPAPDKLALTVARLQALCGPERIGAPRLLDTYGDDRFTLTPVATSTRAPTPRGEVTPPVTSLRRLRPPCEVEVLVQGALPAAIASRSFRGSITACRGPFRRGEEWWQPPEVAGPACDLYDVELQGGLRLRLAGAPDKARWWVLGSYD